MVLGMSWAKPRSLGFSAQTPESTIIDPHWANSRGRFIMQATVDIAGGFPGFARHGACLDGGDLRLYQRALVIDEGTAGGFALAIEAVIGVDADPLSHRTAPIVRVRYVDGQISRLFTVSVRASRSPRRNARPETALKDHLEMLGFGTRHVDAVGTPRYHVAHDDADRFADERVIWNGHASAPIQLGGTPDRSELWVTDRSLVWANQRSGAVVRVPLEEVRDAAPGTTGSRGQTAVAYVGVGLGAHDRIEVPFVFDAYASSAENANERSKFVGALFSRGIATVQINIPWQPWRVVAVRQAVTSATQWPEHVTPIGVSASLDEALRQPAPAAAAASVDSRSRQATTAADRLRPDRGFVIHGSDSYGYVYRAPERPTSSPVDTAHTSLSMAPVADLDSVDDLDMADDELALELADDAVVEIVPEALSSADVAERPIPASASDADPAPDQTVGAAEDFERSAISAIRAAFDVISARRGGDFTVVAAARPASDADRAAALASVIEEMAAGSISAASAVLRKKRLEALADAGSRLHRLLDEHAAGRVSIEDLVAERIRIDSGLTNVVAQG